MDKNFTQENYDEMIRALFCRFPSFQKAGAGAYKPGIANMEFADQLMGHPHRKYRIIHVAGTNGKGSVSNMLASVLASCGLKVGLYTSPHILDFRERMRIVEEPSGKPSDGVVPGHEAAVEDDCRHCCEGKENMGVVSFITARPSFRLIPEKDVWDFVQKWNETFDHLDMSFFEITTLMALDWFAKEEADVVVLETGLGGRLDSTNIVNPVLSVITNIGLDHCDMLGDTLAEIAFEKAGIIKPKVPVVVGESCVETDPVFERKVLYTNLPEPEFMGSRNAIMSLLTFADKVEPSLWESHEDILAQMDLRGDYQRKNLRTVLAALDALKPVLPELGSLAFPVTGNPLSDLQAVVTEGGQVMNNMPAIAEASAVVPAIVNTAVRTGFAGRWQKISDCPMTICDIGHNEHGLKYNFAQLTQMKASGKCTDLIIVYGSVADKDVDSVIHLMPEQATYIFTQADSKRALAASAIMEKFMKYRSDVGLPCVELSSGIADVDPLVFTEPFANEHRAYAVTIPEVTAAVAAAREIAARLIASNPSSIPLIYIGGSTYVVSEAVAM